MTHHPILRRGLVALAVVSLGLGVAACTDEDGDGANTDEEVEQLDEGTEDFQSDVGDEVDEGSEELSE